MKYTSVGGINFEDRKPIRSWQAFVEKSGLFVALMEKQKEYEDRKPMRIWQAFVEKWGLLRAREKMKEEFEALRKKQNEYEGNAHKDVNFGDRHALREASEWFSAECRSLSSTVEKLKADRTSLLEQYENWQGDSRTVEVFRQKLRSTARELKQTQERFDDCNAAIKELRKLNQDMHRQKLKAVLRARKDVLHLMNVIICILHFLLNKSGNLRRGSLCDYGTIQILLVRSGLESNPGPRAWRDLPTTNRYLGILSSHIGKCWQYYSDRLGVEEEDRDDIVAKYPESVQLQTYHMLKQAARLPHNQNMGTMLTLLEDCAEEFVDMRVDWDMIKYYFADAEEIRIAVEPFVERQPVWV